MVSASYCGPCWSKWTVEQVTKVNSSDATAIHPVFYKHVYIDITVFLCCVCANCCAHIIVAQSGVETLKLCICACVAIVLHTWQVGSGVTCLCKQT